MHLNGDLKFFFFFLLPEDERYRLDSDTEPAEDGPLRLEVFSHEEGDDDD